MLISSKSLLLKCKQLQADIDISEFPLVTICVKDNATNEKINYRQHDKMLQMGINKWPTYDMKADLDEYLRKEEWKKWVYSWNKSIPKREYFWTNADGGKEEEQDK